LSLVWTEFLAKCGQTTLALSGQKWLAATILEDRRAVIQSIPSVSRRIVMSFELIIPLSPTVVNQESPKFWVILSIVGRKIFVSVVFPWKNFY
jgi:hypothetical protein